MFQTERVNFNGLTDVWIALGLLIAANIAVVVSVPDRLRLSVVAVTLFFLPGYAVTTLLFPTQPTGQQSEHESAPGYWERAALAVGMSVVFLPLLGMLLSVFSLGVTPVTGMAVVSMVTILALAGGVIRRNQYQAERRYQLSIPFAKLRDQANAWRRPDDDTQWVDKALSGLLVVAIIAAAMSFAFVVTAPSEPATYTEASLLAEADSGELVAENYPTEFDLGDEASLAVDITNYEGESVTYSVVVQQQRLTDSETPTVVDREELQTERSTVADGETWRYDHTLEPTFSGSQLRVVYLIYKGEPPEQPTVDNADEHLSVSIDVN